MNPYSASSITVMVTGSTTATGAASAGAAIPNASSGEKPRYIRVAATVACTFRIGTGAQTALTTDMLIQPGDAVVLHVPSGVTHYAAIQVAAAGVVQVSPLENM
jgi:aspartate/methionine/tyrosine aminotransferase